VSDHQWTRTIQTTDFEHRKRVAILRSYGTTVCHVSATELQKILKYNASDSGVHHAFKGLDIEIHDFHVEKDLVKFLAHWIHHRDPGEAINASMGRLTEREVGAFNEDRLVYLIRAMNFFDDPFTFTSDITDSLVDQLLDLLKCGGPVDIDHVYRICKNSCQTPALTSAFANVFIHRKKQFAQQVPTCEYDRAVQGHMHRWLSDVLVNDGDWSKLPSQLREPDDGRDFDYCFHHQHGEEKDCYFDGRIVKSG
jgi:hypothetical protein